MSFRQAPLESPIKAKIAWAEKCFREKGDLLLEDKGIADLLGTLQAAIHRSHDEMVQSGIADECRDCEQIGGGSCCGAGLEDRYGGTLLLINLLLGVHLPDERNETSSCFFLGKTGCRLLARDVICINYLCKTIDVRMDSRKIAALREKEGVEVNLLFHLHERVKKVLVDQASDPL
jgi:hypothetical protein